MITLANMKRPALTIAALAAAAMLFTTTGAAADRLITGRDIKDGSIRMQDLAPGVQRQIRDGLVLPTPTATPTPPAQYGSYVQAFRGKLLPGVYELDFSATTSNNPVARPQVLVVLIDGYAETTIDEGEATSFQPYSGTERFDADGYLEVQILVRSKGALPVTVTADLTPVD